VDKNTTVGFPLMSTIGELGAFLTREDSAGAAPSTPTAPITAETEPLPNGQPLAFSTA
jgi:hypothetical protein